MPSNYYPKKENNRQASRGGYFFRLAERRLTFVLSAIIFRLSLEASFFIFISEFYGYSGFTLDIYPTKYVESWLIFFAFFFTTPNVLNKPSDFFMVLLFAGLLTPMLVLYGLQDKPRDHLYIVLMGIFLLDMARRGRPFRVPTVLHGPHLAALICLLLSTIVTGWYVASGGLRYFNLDLSAVYEYRRDVGAITNVGVMGYINNWAPKVAGPALIAWFLWKRSFILAAATVFLHVIWFGVSAHKAVLFYPLLVIFSWFWFQKTRALSFVLMGTSAAVLASLMIFLLLDYPFLASLFIRRVFFVIASNTFDYYEFFSQNQKVLWSNSLGARFLDYPYHVNPALLIGEWRGTESHVNNSFLATGYMHAGVWGIIVYGLVAGLLFRLIDSFSHVGIPVWLAVAVMLIPSRSLILSADLPTALLTHGIGLACLLLFLMRSRSVTIKRQLSFD